MQGEKMKREFDSQCPYCYETRQPYVDVQSGTLNFILPLVCLHKVQCEKQLRAELKDRNNMQFSVAKAAGQRWTDRLQRKQPR